MTAELFRVDALAQFIGIFVAVFTLLILCYSLEYVRGRGYGGRFAVYVVLTFLCGEGVVFADNWMLFLVLWGFLGVLLFLLIGLEGTAEAAAAAKKALVLIGATDALLLLGIVLLGRLPDAPGIWEARLSGGRLELAGGLELGIFLCFLAAALAKAGAMPLHTWVPDTAEHAPIPVSAYLPASLDKLLGIYFLARIVLELFVLPDWMLTALMALGSFTIVAAVMMALVQHDLRRLLGYHAVSQVGYMVLGLGTGNVVGAAGGLFHMLNNAVYKSCLFLGGGSVIHRTGTADLDKLGGLAKRLPWTFALFLISALAISGIPPLNGFASKWLVYQGVLAAGKGGQSLWFLWLVAAMFGTALTMASFMKLVHALFLGRSGLPAERLAQVQEVGWLMRAPMPGLALACIVFGVFAMAFPVAVWIWPAVGGPEALPGLWNAGVATLLLLGAALTGGLIYWLAAVPRLREVEPFVGGEFVDQHPQMRVSGVEFYRTVRRLPWLAPIYERAERGWFDLYELCSRLVSGLGKGCGALHNGLLPRYVEWCLVGVLIVLVYLRSSP